MGNHQINPKRQHRPSESVGFNKHDSDDERLVTLQQRERRVRYIFINKANQRFFIIIRFQQKVHHHLKRLIFQFIRLILALLVSPYLLCLLMHMHVSLVLLLIGLNRK